MANALYKDKARHIIVGLVSNGELRDVSVPHDEAFLQQHLEKITPVPNVSFHRLNIEGVNLVVVEIMPPYDRPYVARSVNENHVWIRKGTKIRTASRYQLDRFYELKKPKPGLNLYWPGENGEETDTLSLEIKTVDVASKLDRLKKLKPSKDELRLVESHKDELLRLIRQLGPDLFGVNSSHKPEWLAELPIKFFEKIDKISI